MKNFKLLLIVVLFLFNEELIFGQSDSISIIKPFGMGLHIEHFGLNNRGDINNGLANKVLLSISPINKLRLEPEIGFKFNSVDANQAVYLGLGIFTMIQKERLNFYFGLRLKYSIIKWEDFQIETINGNSTIITIYNKIKRFSIGHTLGCEYYFGNNFSLGGEFAFVYGTINIIEPEPIYSDGKSNTMSSDIGLFIRFYF